MEPSDITNMTTAALKLCLFVSLPAVIAAAVTGIIISFVQAITSLQDASISHSLKLIVVVAVLAITSPWAATSVVTFAQSAYRAAFP